MNDNLSVIIISHNPGNLLDRCLEKLLKEDTITSPNNSEWIIVDNGSIDNSLERATHKYPNIFCIRNKENKGFAYAANQGFKAAKNEYLLYVNTDIELIDSAASKMLNILKENSKVAVVGPRLLRPDGSIQKSVLTYPTFWDGIIQPYIKLKLHFKEGLYKEKIWYDVPLIKGACFLIRKSVLESLNGFDENFFFYYEETDLFYRLKSKGYKIAYIPSAKVMHLGGATVKKSRDDFKKHFRRSYIVFLRKHYPKWQSYLMERYYRLSHKI